MCEELKNLESASPAVKLFAEYCKHAPSDSLWRSRLKVVPHCLNLRDVSIPAMVKAANATPVLLQKSVSLFRGFNSLEIDIHAHKFNYVAKKSIHSIASKAANMCMEVGFMVEGREVGELPETLFACIGINWPQYEKALKLPGM